MSVTQFSYIRLYGALLVPSGGLQLETTVSLSVARATGPDWQLGGVGVGSEVADSREKPGVILPWQIHH